MSKVHIDPATLTRIEQTAALVRSVVEQALARLHVQAQSSTNPQRVRELPAPLSGEHLERTTAAVEMLASHVLGSLFTMCELITRNSNPTPEVRAQFAHILSRRPATNRQLVDLRLQRLLRLPVGEALAIVLQDLEFGCAEVDRQICALTSRIGPEASRSQLSS